MTVKIDGTNTEANPAFTGADTDTGLQCGTNELKLVTGGTARATVDSSGNVGIGTSSPSSYGGAVKLAVASTGNTSFTIASGTSSDGTILFADGTSGDATYRGQVKYSHLSDSMQFSTAAGERMRILSSGGLTFNGDTAAANALDDYEEGTWTPTTAGDSTGAISNASGFYTKVGNVVVCSFSFNLTTNFTNSDVGGLPFTPKDIGPNFNGAFVQTTADRAFIVQNHTSRLANLKISTGTYPAVTNSTRCTITYLTA